MTDLSWCRVRDAEPPLNQPVLILRVSVTTGKSALHVARAKRSRRLPALGWLTNDRKLLPVAPGDWWTTIPTPGEEAAS